MSHAVIDVDYIDITPRPETDRTRLLPEHSDTPFSVEQRRRERLCRDIVRLTDDIESLLKSFEFKKLHSPRGLGKCPYRWEQDLDERILCSFYTLQESIEDALAEYRRTAYRDAYYLSTCLGLDDREYAEYLDYESQEAKKQELRLIFMLDILSKIDPNTSAYDDDLPF